MQHQLFPLFCGILGMKALVVGVFLSWEQEFHPTTSLDENSIKFGNQTDRNFYVDLRQIYFVLKLKFVKGRGYETYKTKKKLKKEQKEAKANEETEDEQEVPVPLVTNLNNCLHSIFSNVEVYINCQQI